MTQEELRRQYIKIDLEAEIKKADACREFVRQNAKYKVGQIIDDGNGVIRIDELRYSTVGHELISIYYKGPLLTRNLRPKRSGDIYCIFEDKVKRLLY